MSILGELERQALDDRGVLRFITCGSVDDGKSTLIGRLLHDSRAILADQLAAVERASQRRGHDVADLSLLTDGLEAEREQGITIDVAYRYFATGRRKFIIADTPGHEQYTRNMVTGASTADAAVLLVDARKGLLPQTRRHAYIAHLLGIRHLVLAVNKLDLVDFDRATFDAIAAEFAQLVAPLGITDVAAVPLSALAGDNVVEKSDRTPWYAGPPLLELLEGLALDEALDLQPLRFPVQFVVRGGPGDDFRGYAGRLESGTLAVGQEVLVLPTGRTTRIREIRLGDQARSDAVAGDSITVALADDIDISRGDQFVDPAAAPQATKTLEARLAWLTETPLATGRTYLLKHAARTVKARIREVVEAIDVERLEAGPAPAEIRLNAIVRVRLALAQPVFVDDYRDNRATGAFILIDEATNATVAGGIIATN
jgi:sulfate adenylyltransferase subunit 1